MSCSECSPTEGAAGPRGKPGVNGINPAAGVDGINAFTYTTAAYVQPAVLATVDVSVENSEWIVIGQPLFIQTGGQYIVTATPTDTTVTVQNLGYAGNAAVSSTVALNRKVAASGVAGSTLVFPLSIAQGGTGQTTIAAAFNALSPLITQGDILGRNASGNVRIPIGTNGYVLMVDTTEVTKVAWKPIDLSTVSVTGTLTIAKGGTSATTAATAFSNLKQAASETSSGVLEIATQTETDTGTDDLRAITPLKLQTRLTKYTATATLNFGSISAAASEDLTIALTGATTNNSVSLGLPAAPTAGIIFQAFVSAADTVTVRATNITGSPVDPASATYRVTLVK